MASLTFLPFASIASPHLYLNPPCRRRILSLGKPREIKSKKALIDAKTSESENVVLKVAWYSSELLGIPASVFRSSQNMIIESPAPATTGGNEVPLTVIFGPTCIIRLDGSSNRSAHTSTAKSIAA
ncbi:hypothetical protein QQ045_000307 [Rhodiola kirilowii]